VVYANPSAEQDADGVQLLEIWRAIRRRQRLVLVVGTSVFAAFSANTLYQRITAPVYAGSFQLLIADPINSSGGGAGSGGGLEGGGGVVESLARNRTSVDIPTLIQTLSSPLVLDPVYQQLGKASGPISSLSVSQAGGTRRAGMVEGVLEVKLLGRKPAEVQRSLDALSQAFLQFALNQKRERLSQGLLFLDQQEPLLVEKVDKLQAKLANFRRQYNLLSPETEAGALKAESMGMATQQRQVEAERTRLLKLRQDIASGRLTAANFSSGGTADAAGQIDGVSVTQARSDLLDQLQSVEQQLAEARSVYRSDSPRVQNLVALRNRLAGQRRSQQLEAVDTSLALNATRSGTLNAQIQQIDRQFLKQPSLIKDYEERQQQLKVAQDNLASFLSTRATFQLEQAQNTLPWKLIAPPQVKGFPEEPSLKKGVFLGLMLGLVSGVGAGLLRDRLDRGFRNPSEVKEELGEALLGHIPHVAFFQGVREDKRFLLQELDFSSSKPVAAAGPEGSPPGSVLADSAEKPGLSGYQRFFYQEAFRNLFTSIRFLSSDKPIRSLALTSSLPSEGKSLVNVLLAKTLSEMGQRVLLVDADMRKPQLHYRLGLNNLTGLSNLLTEPNLHWPDVVHKVQRYDNWSVLTSGTRPPDTTRLLSSNRMHELVQELTNSGQFDLVLFDTPPVLGLADAPLLSQHLDGMILLVSLGQVDRGLPKEAISRVRSSGAQVLGVVTNAVKEESEHNAAYGYGNRYKYGYGSKYGYGYGVYDTRSSYSYYNQDDSEGDGESTAETSQETSRSAWRMQASKLRRRVLDWIDT
jgi:polysaccharide biosynthesis transport protein